MFGVSIMLYTLVRSMPSDYVDLSTSANVKMTDEMRAHLREIYGLDKGIVEGYIDWLTSAIINGMTAEDFLVRSENAYCPPTSMVKDVVISAVEDLCRHL